MGGAGHDFLGARKTQHYNCKLLGKVSFSSLLLTFLFLTRIRNSFGLQKFQLGIITEDSLGQVSQLVVAQVPIKITLETCKVHAEYNRYDKNDT